jgi:DNA-binding MarR family transcriptional regulator
MSHQICPSVTDFLVRLRKIDLRGLTVRDVLVLYAIMGNPGASGMDITHKLGIKDRSAIASNLARLERAGFIEDRRDTRAKAVPGVLYALPAGIAFWDEIKP